MQFACKNVRANRLCAVLIPFLYCARRQATLRSAEPRAGARRARPSGECSWHSLYLSRAFCFSFTYSITSKFGFDQSGINIGLCPVRFRYGSRIGALGRGVTNGKWGATRPRRRRAPPRVRRSPPRLCTRVLRSIRLELHFLQCPRRRRHSRGPQLLLCTPHRNRSQRSNLLLLRTLWRTALRNWLHLRAFLLRAVLMSIPELGSQRATRGTRRADGSGPLR